MIQKQRIMYLLKNGVHMEQEMVNSNGYMILLLIHQKNVCTYQIEMVIVYRYLTKMEHFFSNGVRKELEMVNLLYLTALMLILKEMFGLRTEVTIVFKNLMEMDISFSNLVIQMDTQVVHWENLITQDKFL